MKKASVLLIAVSFLMISCAGSYSKKEKMKIINVPGGTMLPAQGIGFDVNYDSELDGIIPGYKILNVAFTNGTMNLIKLDGVSDEWIVIDRNGRKRKAVINLRSEDPDIWSELPKRLKALIQYPLIVRAGETKTLDILFKEDVELSAYKYVVFRQANSNTEYRIYPRED